MWMVEAADSEGRSEWPDSSISVPERPLGTHDCPEVKPFGPGMRPTWVRIKGRPVMWRPSLDARPAAGASW